MLTVDTDIQHWLIKIPSENVIRKVFVKFLDPYVVLKAFTAIHFSRQLSWVGIEKKETEIPHKIRLATSINQETQSTVHKVQGFNLDQIVDDFN